MYRVWQHCDQRSVSMEFVKVKEEPYYEEDTVFNYDNEPHIKQKVQPVKTEITEEYDCSDCDEEDLANNEEQANSKPKDHNKGEIDYHCDLSDYTTLQIKPKDHNKPQISVPVQYPCPLCNYATKYRRKLKVHQKTHSKKVYKCDQCNFITQREYSIHKHLLVHSIDNHYTCGQCNYICKDISKIKQHQLTHSNDKPFSCNLCDYQTRHKGSLKRHQKTRHTDSKSFTCNHCHFSSREKSSLKTHMLIHKKDKNLVQDSTLDSNAAKLQYPCDMCDFSAKYKSTLIKHWIIHFKRKPYVKIHKCDISTL